MRKSKQFTSMPVISLEEGKQIGVVKGLVVDPVGKKVSALIIEQKGWFKEQRFIPYHKVNSVGNDAITIEKTSGVERATGLPDIVKFLKDKVGIIGSRIVAANGTVLGFVDEYYIDLDTGTIAGLEFSGNFINSVIKGRAFLDITFVRTLGKEVAVINNDGIDNIIKLDGGLQDTVKTIKESTGQFWENTMQRTKDLGTSINKSLEKVKKDKKFGPESGEEIPGAVGAEEEYRGLVGTAPAEAPGENQTVAENIPREEEIPEKIASHPPGSNGEARKDTSPPGIKI